MSGISGSLNAGKVEKSGLSKCTHNDGGIVNFPPNFSTCGITIKFDIPNVGASLNSEWELSYILMHCKCLW